MLRFSELLEERGPRQKKYHKDLSPSTKKKRVAQFKKQAKMDDDDEDAYEDAPGDKKARKKGVPQSKHTKNYKKRFSESLNESKMHTNSLGKWVHKGPADYAVKLQTVLGQPDVVEKQDYGRVRSATWYNADGFDSLMVEDENTVKYHPIPGVQVYVYGMKKLVVPKDMVEPLHKSSETIKIDQLKNEVTASCASTTICAVTLNFVMDCIAGRSQPTISEYDKRVLSVAEDNKLDPDFDWWPDKTMDIREKPLSESILPTFGTYLIENKAVRNKAKETGISYSILKQVYDRGVAAWKTGHRPGTTPQQWGLARINSFATGGKTRTTADKDLWKKHSASKKKKKVNEEKTSELIKKSHESRGRKGTLKAKIKGEITKEKVLALKNDKDATTLDKKQANFWLNMNEDVIMEAEYQGKKVKLNDPIRNSGGKKKFKVYTTHPKTGNVIKVQFGDPGLSIKRDNDDRRKAFRARHGCDAVTFESDRHTPKYWSCKMWTKSKKVSDLD